MQSSKRAGPPPSTGMLDFQGVRASMSRDLTEYEARFVAGCRYRFCPNSVLSAVAVTREAMA